METIDIVIPVYNEGRNILGALKSLRDSVRTPFRVLICYDRDDDDTLPALHDPVARACEIVLVRNRSRGAHAAILSGFRASSAPAVLVFPADDTCNAPIVDRMVALCDDGCAIVAASRFMPGGSMRGCPWLKALLVRTSAFTLHRFAGIPTHDPSNGFRLFSRRVLEQIVIESSQGFTYSIELLVKAHRLGWRICQVPAQWFERTQGESRFRVLKWLPAYLRWYGYAFATTFLGRGPATVTLRK
jgi:glycosyltransferase involved in cell wall biosynthesis